LTGSDSLRPSIDVRGKSLSSVRLGAFGKGAQVAQSKDFNRTDIRSVREGDAPRSEDRNAMRGAI